MDGFNFKVYDASAIVYTGTLSKYYKDLSYYNFPVGGIHYFNRFLVLALQSAQNFAIVFDSHSRKCNTNSGYKSGRPRTPAVISQLEFLYEMLSQCGVACAKVDGYEADDIIDWYAQEYHDRYASYEIYTDDADNAHSIWYNGEVHPCSSNGKHINYSNFEKTVKPGVRIPFNTISLYKIICGCASDKIPSINVPSPNEVFQNFCKFLDENYIYGYEKTAASTDLLVEVLLEWDPSLPKDQLYRNKQLVLPAERPEGVVLNFGNKNTVLNEKLAVYLSMVNDRQAMLSYGLGGSILTNEQKEYMKGLGKALSSGEYMADRNINPDNYEVSDLHLFTRDF